MPIPQDVRDQIGIADLAPVWRLSARTESFVFYDDLTPDVVTAEGPAISARLDLTTAPARTLEITTTETGPLNYVNADEREFEFAVGYRTPDGINYYETIGTYYIADSEESDGEVVTRFASSEVLIIGKINAGINDTSGNPMLAAAETALTHPTATVSVFIDEVVRAAAPAPWDYAAPLSADGDWTPTSLDEFDTAIGTDVWGALLKVATAAGKRLVPTVSPGWHTAPAVRTPGTPQAVIARTLCENFRTIRAPRDELRAYLVRYTRLAAGEEVTELMGNYSSPYPDIRRGEVATLDGISTFALASAYRTSRWEAENTLVRQHSFIAPAMPWLQPEDTITLTDPAGNVDVMISTISYDVIAGKMTVTAREIL